MTAADFRRLALSFPGAAESAHIDHPDFRVNAKIFATLTHDESSGMVPLTPEQQAVVVGAHPEIFAPVPGGWGRRGATVVTFAHATESVVREALALAWERRAPKRLLGNAEAAPPRAAATSGSAGRRKRA